ncbi:hypothetical protein [Thiorhodospira sibirica]|uniref:hypothetical protein n=1 Tax=Thiorhodospira sibirica TaxID=154347 RepID=UPI00022C1CCD|nr:hypothetical protein [Thiorhodospira sibirica]
METPTAPRLDVTDLIRLRLLCAPPEQGLTYANLKKDLKDWLPATLPWPQTLDDHLKTLQASGELISPGRARYLLSEAAVAQSQHKLGRSAQADRPRWNHFSQGELQALALGLEFPRNEAERKRLRSVDGLRALILVKHYQLSTRPFPTLTQARDALLWQHLSHPDTAMRLQSQLKALNTPAFSQGMLMKVLLNDLLAPGNPPALNWQPALNQLVAKCIGARRIDASELRKAVVRRAMTPPAELSASPPSALAAVSSPPLRDRLPAPIDLVQFARVVMNTAQHTQSGRFGRDKIFISHVWAQLCQQAAQFGLDEAQFKEYLTRANNQGLLRLSRADMAHILDQEDVARSETHYLNSAFHFIHLD